ncbi:hypothetical protein JQS30_06190 [Natronoglycomyces albus]|uniref:ShKT domain-containing protein n=1 Tax=Natronoglycomyces albus TaxID=2811108 RepID=A0A895XT49_9ACTN|nr:hypothetical protein JQS30_06190 [Natronoglycomyces albus]
MTIQKRSFFLSVVKLALAVLLVGLATAIPAAASHTTDASLEPATIIETEVTADCEQASDSEACVDRLSTCPAMANLCGIAMYSSFMALNCPKTCNTCPPPSAPPACQDHENCAQWVANGFCSNPFYTVEQKRQYCPNACNLCDRPALTSYQMYEKS